MPPDTTSEFELEIDVNDRSFNVVEASFDAFSLIYENALELARCFRDANVTYELTVDGVPDSNLRTSLQKIVVTLDLIPVR